MKKPSGKRLGTARRRWPLALLPLLLFIPLVAAADQAAPSSQHATSAAATAAGISGPNTIGQGTFGEGVKGWADPSSGAAVASYNFALPAARGVPQPQVRLRYNSNSGMGDAGPGWSFDIPVIERKPIWGG